MSDFDPAFHLKPPTRGTLREHLMARIIRELIPYAEREERGTKTSLVTRSLIAEAKHVTK